MAAWRRWPSYSSRSPINRENQQLQERNRILEAEVLELKSGMETVEERALYELGMIKEGETLYQLAE